MRKETAIFRVTARDLKVGDDLVGGDFIIERVLKVEVFLNDHLKCRQVDLILYSESNHRHCVILHATDQVLVVE